VIILNVPLSTWPEVPGIIIGLSASKGLRLARVLAACDDGECAAIHHVDCKALDGAKCVCRPVTLRAGATA
jgi:hypothetical protein